MKQNMEKQIFVKKEAVGEFGINPDEKTTETLLKYGIINIDSGDFELS